MTDGDTETQDLLKLELDGGSDLVDLSGKVLRVRDWGREFTSLGKTRTEQSAMSDKSSSVLVQLTEGFA